MLHHILCIRVSTHLKNNSPSSLLKAPLNLQTVQAFGHTGMLILILIDVQYSQLFLAFTISLSLKLNCFFIFQITINRRIFNGHSKKVFQLFQTFEKVIKNMDAYSNKKDT